MMNTKALRASKNLWGTAAWAAAGLAAAVAISSVWAPADGPEPNVLLEDRLWIERLPETDTDMVMLFAAVKDDRQKVGTLAQASSWRVVADNFTYKLNGRRLQLRFPQHGVDVGLKANARACKAPEPFELCLDLATDDGGRARFYSRKDWKIAELEDADVAVPHVGTATVAGLPRLAD